MKKLVLLFTLIVFGYSALVAQDQNRLGDRVENNLKLLGRKIEQIRILAERYENEEALKTIQSAREDFDASIDLLQQWQEDRNRLGLLEQARTKYQSANLKADLASRILLFKPAANLLKQLELLIQQAESLVQGSDASDLRYYLSKARNYYKLAQNSFSGNRYLRGHEYLKIASYFAEKVISLARGNNISDRGARFEEHKNNILMLLHRVDIDMQDNRILHELDDNIREYLRRATQAYAQGNLKRAFVNLQIAERLTYRFIDLSEEDSNASVDQRIEQEYQSLSRYLLTLRNEFERENSQSPILDKAEEFRLKARRNLDNKQYKQASTNLKLAQRMAQRAFNKLSAQNVSDNENLDSRLNDIQNLVNLQESRIEKQQNILAKILFVQLQELFRQGQQNYQSGSYAKASYYFNITLRLLNRNEKILRRETNDNVSAETVLADLNQVGQFINRLKLNPSLDNISQSRISVLENLLEKARNNYDSRNYLITREIIAVIQNQLANLSNN